MKIQFNIDYHTQWGQQVYVCGTIPELGNGLPAQALPLNIIANEHWQATVELPSTTADFNYFYFVASNPATEIDKEWGSRYLKLEKSKNSYLLKDAWRPKSREENTFFTTAFQNALLPKPAAAGKKKRITLKKSENLFRFQIQAARVPEGHQLCLLGSSSALGNWSHQEALLMTCNDEALWSVDVALNSIALPLEYKYGFYNIEKKDIVAWESRDFNRVLRADITEEKTVQVITDEAISYPFANWKGAGVAIPVFSLRSKSGMGVGEFNDLKLLADWSEKVNIKLIQILPINDTVANHNWKDSYPYSAISVFALHPMYLNMEHLGQLASKTTRKIIAEVRDKLNESETVEYNDVMRTKSRYIKMIYGETKEQFFKDKKAQQFLKENAHWIKAYAAFSFLRDLYRTPDFKQWGAYATFDEKVIDELVKPSSQHYDEIAIHYFIQYHLHLQLLDAADYARKKGIVLKGDIPIGIYRYSVDAWMNPSLYRMDCQAGAPPDAFAVNGQNWGFPTYNWEEMAKDGFSWWKSRMTNMGTYFDAFRIDHILGFFRIWEIPWDAVQGILGYFNPCLPITKQEFYDRQIHFDYDRLVKPYIREHFLHEIFGEDTAAVKAQYLNEYQQGCFEMKPEFDTQRKVEEFLAHDESLTNDEQAYREQIKLGLFGLIANVVLVEIPKTNHEHFSPRIAMHQTRSYQELDEYSRAKLNEMYIDFFYHRQEDFWRTQAMVKLPALKEATNMLICGEDLGMVPDCVPPVMDELGMLSLEIQRMPKNPKVEFGHPAHAPYLSVVTPSCHDMSTIRGWWEEDPDQTQAFFNHMLGHHGGAPYYCETWLAEEMVNQHLWSPAMWAIFPIQDLVAMNADLRKQDAKSEQINVPANPNHQWKYRFHLNLEDLMKETEFNEHVKQMIQNCGR
ncbi:4-alpha-glucanotransferase [Persicobacter psychrovividus]|uniref:4-alpha-glucanotransferase n=1 Tax=Persicobacter psychrovividus TaxID=387638 RepID=A0ABM7VGA9_9BACT|nr:4-alpha-glucanotransferase [Persicobacter psychrovividus]